MKKYLEWILDIKIAFCLKFRTPKNVRYIAIKYCILLDNNERIIQNIHIIFFRLIIKPFNKILGHKNQDLNQDMLLKEFKTILILFNKYLVLQSTI